VTTNALQQRGRAVTDQFCTKLGADSCVHGVRSGAAFVFSLCSSNVQQCSRAINMRSVMLAIHTRQQDECVCVFTIVATCAVGAVAFSGVVQQCSRAVHTHIACACFVQVTPGDKLNMSVRHDCDKR